MKSPVNRVTARFASRLYNTSRMKAAETGQTISKVINDAVRMSLAEDAADLDAFDERAKEPNLPFESVLKGLTTIPSH